MKLELVAGNHDIEGMVRAALSELRAGRDACEVHLHPEDAERLAKVPFGSAVAILPDTRVRRGDVVVSSPQGQLVRSLDEGLAAVAQALRAELSP
jgi:flagellar biosynthesis/type III secretory pathway protein FliH